MKESAVQLELDIRYIQPHPLSGDIFKSICLLSLSGLKRSKSLLTHCTNNRWGREGAGSNKSATSSPSGPALGSFARQTDSQEVGAAETVAREAKAQCALSPALNVCTENISSEGSPPCRSLPSGQADPGTPGARAKPEGRCELTDLGTHHHQGRLGWRCSLQSVRCRHHHRSGPAAPRGLPGKQDGGKNGKQNKTRTKKAPIKLKL